MKCKSYALKSLSVGMDLITIITYMFLKNISMFKHHGTYICTNDVIMQM